MNYRKFKDIKHKFPEDSWMKQRNESHAGEFDEEIILHIEGDFETGNLDLDAPLISFRDRFDNYETYLEHESCMAILVEGNLKANNIFNEETDGSTCLLVLGNLTANNVVVGGQELYVTGNLNVHNCFWGDYNHGALIVSGNTNARVFVATHEYHYDYEKKGISASFFLLDDDPKNEGDYEQKFVKYIFEEELVQDEFIIDLEGAYSWKDWILRRKALEFLTEDKAIIHSEIVLKEEEPGSEKLFVYQPVTNQQTLDAEINNFQKLFDGVVALNEEEEQAYEQDGWLITFYKSFGDKALPTIIAVKGDVRITLSYLVTKNLLGIKKVSQQHLAVLLQLNNGKTATLFKDDNTEASILLFNQLWQFVLRDAERGAYYFKHLHNGFDVKKAYGWFSLPIVADENAEAVFENLEDSEIEDEWRKFWVGSYNYAFRTENAEAPKPLVLQIGRELKGDDFDMRNYRFRFNAVKNPTSIFLKYNSSQEERSNDRYTSFGGEKVYPFDWRLYGEALEWYQRAEPAINRKNEEYLEEKHEQALANLPYLQWEPEDLYKKLTDTVDEFYFEEIFDHEYLAYELEKAGINAEADEWTYEMKQTAAEGKEIVIGFKQKKITSDEDEPVYEWTLDINNPFTNRLSVFHCNQQKPGIQYYCLTSADRDKKMSECLITASSEKHLSIELLQNAEGLKSFFELKESFLEQLELEQLKTTTFEKPFESLLFEGITFKVIDRHEAHVLIGELSGFNNEKIYDVYKDGWRFPINEENAFFLLTDEDVIVEKFDLDYSTEEEQGIFILGFIFRKNLRANKYIMAYDSDSSPALIVLGNVQTINIKLFGNVHYIGNGLECDTLWGFYNHGELFVKGSSDIMLVYADDMRLHFENFTGLGAAISSSGSKILINTRLGDEHGKEFNAENYMPSTHKLSDIVFDNLLVIDEHGDECLNEDAPFDATAFLLNGETLVDEKKEDRYGYTHFEQRLLKGFDALCKQQKTKGGEFIRLEEEDIGYFFNRFKMDGDMFRVLNITLKGGYKIRMSAVYSEADKANTLILSYLNDDGDPKYEWKNPATSNMLELKCVKAAVLKAFEKLGIED